MIEKERELEKKNRELGLELVRLQARISNPLAGRGERGRLDGMAEEIAGEIEKNNSMLGKLKSDREFAERFGRILKLV